MTVTNGQADFDASIEGKLFKFLVALFPGPLCALEWGEGRFFRALSRRDEARDELYFFTGDAAVHAEFAGDTDSGEPRRRVFLVAPSAEAGDQTRSTTSPDDSTRLALAPSALGQTFHLAFLGSSAPVGCVATGFLLLRQAGLVVAMDPPGAPPALHAAPRGAFVVRVTDPSAGTGLTLVCKDSALGEPLVAALGASLPGHLRVEGFPPGAAGGVAAERPRVEFLAPASRRNAPSRPPLPPPGAFTPSCVFINTYYPAFLASHYRRNSGLASAPYAEQKASLLASCFGDSDFYSRGLAAAGWHADDLIVNCEPLQIAWAREAGFRAQGLIDIAIEQLRRAEPHVVYLQDLVWATPELLARIRPHTDLVVGQIASPLPAECDPRELDALFTSLPHFAKRFRAKGVTAYYQPLAFDPRVLACVPESERVHPVTFVGGVSGVHVRGSQVIESVCAKTPIDIWGYGAERLPADSIIRRHHRGEAWGPDMFGILRRSRITLNRHADFAETYANNMRLYEATGCGAMLITDYKDNLDDLFEIGKEVVAFRTPEEAVALIHYYLAHPDEAAAIALAGHERTLASHTYERRMKDTGDVLLAHLRRTRDQAHFRSVELGEISTGHAPIEASAITPELTQAWKNDVLPLKQRVLVTRELEAMYRGRTVPPMEVLTRALRPVVSPTTSVLEIGCSSGYYREVLRYLLDSPFPYTGIDYSPAMIALAKTYYPEGNFLVADGARLPFPSDSFSIAVSSCIILHTPNYQEHLAETVRVAGDHVVLHRTPICRQRPTSHQQKRGYGVDMVELVFNEDELVTFLRTLGLELVDRFEFHSNPAADEFSVTYLWRKAA